MGGGRCGSVRLGRGGAVRAWSREYPTFHDGEAVAEDGAPGFVVGMGRVGLGEKRFARGRANTPPFTTVRLSRRMGHPDLWLGWAGMGRGGAVRAWSREYPTFHDGEAVAEDGAPGFVVGMGRVGLGEKRFARGRANTPPFTTVRLSWRMGHPDLWLGWGGAGAVRAFRANTPPFTTVKLSRRMGHPEVPLTMLG